MIVAHFSPDEQQSARDPLLTPLLMLLTYAHQHPHSRAWLRPILTILGRRGVARG
jgi:hypothetical protein